MSPVLFHLLALPIGIALIISRDMGWRWGIMSFAAWLLSACVLFFAFVVMPDCSVAGACTESTNTWRNIFYGFGAMYWVALGALLLNMKSLFKSIVAILGLPAAVLFIDLLFMG